MGLLLSTSCFKLAFLYLRRVLWMLNNIVSGVACSLNFALLFLYISCSALRIVNSTLDLPIHRQKSFFYSLTLQNGRKNACNSSKFSLLSKFFTLILQQKRI